MKSPEPTSLHTVLGASGAVGQAVIRELQARDLPVRAVSRSTVPEGIETMAADLRQEADVAKVVAGASHVYLCVGLSYSATVWEKEWPLVMRQVIAACAREGAVLVFLDNVYMYGPAPLRVPFTETHRQEPSSRKGKVRKAIADQLLDAVAKGEVQGVIGRAPDFLGAGAVNSIFYILFLERMLQGKAPQSTAVPNVVHTYADVADLGRALVALALDPVTHGQVWHLPVGEPITVEGMQAHFNAVLGTNYQVSFLPAILRRILAWFVPILREVNEMQYQFETPYIMSDAKFRAHFSDFQTPPYAETVAQMVAHFRQEPVLS
jgi:nucleoside-diphosphate-sugar epimerase